MLCVLFIFISPSSSLPRVYIRLHTDYLFIWCASNISSYTQWNVHLVLSFRTKIQCNEPAKSIVSIWLFEKKEKWKQISCESTKIDVFLFLFSRHWINRLKYERERSYTQNWLILPVTTKQFIRIFLPFLSSLFFFPHFCFSLFCCLLFYCFVLCLFEHHITQATVPCRYFSIFLSLTFHLSIVIVCAVCSLLGIRQHRSIVIFL